MAFGVASGSTAAAGLVTAIIAGIVIGSLSGAPYQISGPTGAMSAVLIVLAQRYGLEAVWISGALSGILLFLLGILKLGRFVAFVPAPVISGFTSGIAVIIMVGQLDNLFGINSPNADSAVLKLLALTQHSFEINPYSLIMGLAVAFLILLWPARLGNRFPATFLAIILATAAEILFEFPVDTIREIPRSLLLTHHLTFASLDWISIEKYIVPTLSITALGAVESLLCGAVAGKMTGKPLHANQELIAQGLGNMLIPFCGGVPATAAIARTSVAIKSGGQTRAVSIIHALALLISMWFFAPIISRVPLPALAGVLIATACRMNEWHALRFYFNKRLFTAITKFLVTLIATISLDLTWAILIGVSISALMFLNQASHLTVSLSPVDPTRLDPVGKSDVEHYQNITVAYVTGPLFFAATGHFVEALKKLDNTHSLILSMRGVPLIDSSGLMTLSELSERLERHGAKLLFAGLNPAVESLLSRGGLIHRAPTSNVFWSAGEAISAAAKAHAK